MSYHSLRSARPAKITASLTELQAADHRAWQRLYREAPSGDIWHPLPFLEEFFDRIAPIRRLPVVDLACGDGGQICGLPPDLAIVGIDQSSEALVRARLRLEDNERKALLVEAFVEATGLADASAGGAMSIDVLCCFLDPEPVLIEAFRILAPGAALGVTTFTPDDPLARNYAALAGQPVWIEGFINVFYHPQQVEDLMEAAGFQVEYSARRSDVEDLHLGYRDTPHTHDRAIVVGRKPEA